MNPLFIPIDRVIVIQIVTLQINKNDLLFISTTILIYIPSAYFISEIKTSSYEIVTNTGEEYILFLSHHQDSAATEPFLVIVNDY